MERGLLFRHFLYLLPKLLFFYCPLRMKSASFSFSSKMEGSQDIFLPLGKSSLPVPLSMRIESHDPDTCLRAGTMFSGAYMFIVALTLNLHFLPLCCAASKRIRPFAPPKTIIVSQDTNRSASLPLVSSRFLANHALSSPLFY